MVFLWIFLWFFCCGGEASCDLPHIHGEKITQAFFGTIGVKSGFHDAIEEGDCAITLDKKGIVEGFFLARAPGGDDVFVDLRCRYHGILCGWTERRGLFQFFIAHKIKNKKGCLCFFIFDVYMF